MSSFAEFRNVGIGSAANAQNDAAVPSILNGRNKHLQRFIMESLDKHPYYLDDPTTIGFTLMFDWNTPLFNESEYGESAIKYLESIDEYERAAALKEMKKRLHHIVSIYPYYFQSLSGLEKAYTFTPNKSYEPITLEIETLESLDLRISTIMERYFFASYDHRYRRQMLPSNLRQFTLYVLLSEIRDFRTFVKETVTGKSDMKIVDLNERLSTMIFIFPHSEFDVTGSFSWLSEINNSEPVVAANTLSIECPVTLMSHKMEYLELMAKSDSMSDVLVGYKLNAPGKTTQQTVIPPRPNLDIGRKIFEPLENRSIIPGVTGIDTIENLFKRELNEFLITNDPILAAQRLYNRNIAQLIDAKLKKVILGNVFDQIYAAKQLNLSDYLQGKIDKLGTSDTQAFMRENVYEDDIDPNTVNLSPVLLGNVLGFESFPISATMRAIVKSQLGNIFTRGNNIA